jgi:hypothetical protein
LKSLRLSERERESSVNPVLSAVWIHLTMLVPDASVYQKIDSASERAQVSVRLDIFSVVCDVSDRWYLMLQSSEKFSGPLREHTPKRGVSLEGKNRKR